jgi:hypothetical protein
MAILPRRIPARFCRRPTRFSRMTARTFAREPLARGALARKARRLGAGAIKKLRALRVLVVVAAGLVMLAVVAFMVFSSSFRLSRIRVHRQDLRTDVQEIQQVLRPFFGRHLLLLSFASVERQVREAFPEVAHVSLNVDYPGILDVTLSMDPIVMTAIVHDPGAREGGPLSLHLQNEGGGGSAFITSRGVFLLYHFPTEELLPRLHIVDWVRRPVHRERILLEEDLFRIKTAQATLGQEFGHQVLSTVLYLRAREFHVLTERLSLWFDFASPIEDQLQRYRVFVRSVPLQDVSAYVDLRLRDKVIYK